MSEAFPSKYLKAEDLQDRQVRTIMGEVMMENIGDDDRKPVLYFTKTTLPTPDARRKGLVLNKTNAKVIKTAYGDDTENWLGKELLLFTALVDFRGDQVEGIRVRIPKPVKAPAAAAPKQQEQTENPGDGFDDTVDDIADTF